MNEKELNDILSISLVDVIESLEKNNLSYRIIKRDSNEWNTYNEWLKKFPIASHGRIKWSEVPNSKCYEWWDWEEMRTALSNILNEIQELKDTPVYLTWSNDLYPFFEVNYEALFYSGDVIIDAHFDAWIICPSKGWCIEKYHDNEICFGYIKNRQ